MLKQNRLLAATTFFCACGWVCIVSASGQSVAGTMNKGNGAKVEGVRVSDFDTVQLNVQNTDLNSVLQLLSVQGRRNIVPSAKVKGTVTANLYDVTFHEALDAVLQQNGCGYVEKGDFIFVYTMDELQQIRQAERKVTFKLIRLKYITATDAAGFVTPLLSSAGSIAINGEVAAGIQPTVADAGADSYAFQNIMVVRDYPENLDEITKVLSDLDSRPVQVLVEATILQADVTEDLAFGVDFSVLSNLAVDAFTNPLNGLSEILTGTVATPKTAGIVNSTVGNAVSGDGGLKVGIFTNNVAAFIRALDSVTDTTILANPKIMVLNRQRADVLVGKKIGYLSTTATSTATTQTVEFLPTGTQLTVRPFVAKEDDDYMIRLELKPSVSDAVIRSVIPGTNTAAVTIPDEITQELTTNVMVRDGQTVVLGGLFKEETTIDREQIPGVGDLPVVGNAFKGRDDSVRRSEVIFLITPHVMRDKALYAAGDAAKNNVEMTRIGARSGLLPWSRSKMTAAHLRDALRSIQNNDREKALWEVDLALGLDPRELEAIRLKEKLTGERTYMPSDSMLEDVVELMVEQKENIRRQEQRSRPMTPDPRPGKSASDGEPLTNAGVMRETQSETAASAAQDINQGSDVGQSWAVVLQAPAQVEQNQQSENVLQTNSVSVTVTASDQTADQSVSMSSKVAGEAEAATSDQMNDTQTAFSIRQANIIPEEDVVPQAAATLEGSKQGQQASRAGVADAKVTVGGDQVISPAKFLFGENGISNVLSWLDVYTHGADGTSNQQLMEPASPAQSNTTVEVPTGFENGMD